MDYHRVDSVVHLRDVLGGIFEVRDSVVEERRHRRGGRGCKRIGLRSQIVRDRLFYTLSEALDDCLAFSVDCLKHTRVIWRLCCVKNCVGLDILGMSWGCYQRLMACYFGTCKSASNFV